MRKVFVLVLVVLMIASMVVLASSGSNESASSSKNTVYATGINNCLGGVLAFPTYGLAIKNLQGQVTGFQGINLLFGYSTKYFFSPLKVDTWNAFWGWGILPMLLVGPYSPSNSPPPMIVLPYFETGTDYLTSSNFYFGTYFLNFSPWFEVGVMF